MAKTILHKQIYKNAVFGGVMNTTLCGRMSEALIDGMNIGDEVTCKLCLKIMSEPSHYRWKNVISNGGK